jgi:hypothetical protein
VQISYEAWLGLTVSEWGVFVYKQGRIVNLEEHVQFMCPDPTSYSNIANTIVPPNKSYECSNYDDGGELAFDEILEFENYW